MLKKNEFTVFDDIRRVKGKNREGLQIIKLTTSYQIPIKLFLY